MRKYPQIFTIYLLKDYFFSVSTYVFLVFIGGKMGPFYSGIHNNIYAVTVCFSSLNDNQICKYLERCAHKYDIDKI